ncbi:hypothetical protein GF420_06060, partial [candidate division GN15 bacterium]|nr:hypothetical protein [candidate division GN15 bacterium]
MKHRHLACVVAFGLLLSLVGCGSVATKKSFYQPITADLEAGNYAAAAARLDSARHDGKYDDKDRLLYFVDAGMAHHYAGNYDTSNQLFITADLAAEELFTKSISRAAASMLLNDNVLEYAGEDYEILYTDLVAALNFLLLGDFDGAFVEIRQAQNKLNLLEDKYADAARRLNQAHGEDTVDVDITYEPKEVRFYNDAFARYLSMHMYAADGKYDDARIAHEYLVDAFGAQPHIYPFPMPDVNYRPEPGNAVLSVVALAGLAPVKEALSLRIRTDKDLDLVQILYDGGPNDGAEYGHIPVEVGEDYYFKFAIPTLVDRPSAISSVRVFTGEQLLGELQIIEDVGLVARETFEAKRTLIYLRTVARAIAKGLIAHRAKEKADTGGLQGWLKKAAIDVVTDLSENADLRCARLLPGRVFVGDIEIEPGVYDLTIEFYDHAGLLLSRQFVGGYEVEAG